MSLVLLLQHLRDYLVAQGLVRDPRANTPALPPMWLEPRNGTPAPGEPEGATGNRAVEVGQDLVVAAFPVKPFPSRRHEGFIRKDAIELILRARLAEHALGFEPGLRAALHDKRGWDMAGMRIEETLETQGLTPLARGAQGFTYTLEYSFERWDQS
jgi:hypothetical protein